MELSDYESAITELLPYFSDHLKCPVQNAYVRTVHGSKYLYLQCQDPDLELTICYDQFFQVPVLYYRKNGQVSGTKYAIVEIHPIFHTPYNMVHPCETAATMAPTKLTGIEYLKLWMALHVTNELPELKIR